MSEVGQIEFLLPVRLNENAVHQVDVHRPARRRANGLEHCGQAEIATAAEDAVGRANDQLPGRLAERLLPAELTSHF